MDIKKINDNIIKCILTNNDLLIRDLKINDLSYGTDEAYELFSEIIDIAHENYGFDPEDKQIIVEATPIIGKRIAIIIKITEDIDNFDSNFNKFYSIDDAIKSNDDLDIYSDNIFKHDNYEKASYEDDYPFTGSYANKDYMSFNDDNECESSEVSFSDSDDNSKKDTQKELCIARIYKFSDFDLLIKAAKLLHHVYNGINSLYKDPESSIYYLAIHLDGDNSDNFIKACHILLEYGKILPVADYETKEAFFIEHYKCIVKDTAIQRLFLF